MKQVILFLSTFLLLDVANAQISDDPRFHQAVIWQGFSHRWTYNHRINCIGDFVQMFTPPTPGLDAAIIDKPTVTHLSASGTGKDSTYYDSYYTLVDTKSAVFYEANEVIKVTGHSKSMEALDTISAYFSPGNPGSYMAHKKKYVTLLNGFQMVSDTFANKIGQLNMTVVDGRYDEKAGVFTIVADIKMLLDCHTIECPCSDIFSYDFDLYFLIIGYDDNDASASTASYTENYKWNTCAELSDGLSIKTVPGIPGGFPYPVTGIKSLKIDLSNNFSKGLHLLDWNCFIGHPEAMVNDGVKGMSATMDFQLKQWRAHMQGTKAAPFLSLWSFREAGKANIEVELITMQFKDMKYMSVEHNSQAPPMYWPAGGIPCYTWQNGKFVVDTRAKQTYDIYQHKMLQYH